MLTTRRSRPKCSRSNPGSTSGRAVDLQRRFILLVAVAVLVVAGLLPLAAILSGSVIVDGTITLQAYRKLLADPERYLNSVGHTLTLAGLTAAIASRSL